MGALIIQTLQGISLSTITTVFNEAFRGYFIPLQFTEEGMAAKIKTEGIDLRYSIGAFDGEELVGFILHAFDKVDGRPTIYNGGTGVVPAFRSKGITASMYHYAIPLLKQLGINTHLLEVIDNNAPAIKVYEGAGFIKQRKLAAYKSTEPIICHLPISIETITEIPISEAYHSMVPAWQNSTASVGRDKEGHCLIGAYQDDVMVGYAAFLSATGRIKQLGVHQAYRSKGIGRAILSYISKASNEQPLVVTNIDESYEPAVRFLEALQFKRIVGLYEMKLKVT